MARSGRVGGQFALCFVVCIGLATAATPAELEDPPIRRLADFPDEYVEGELIVMFSDDAGRHASNALEKKFSSALKDSSAGSLDELVEKYGIREMQRVFRGLEDANGKLRYTARTRALIQRQKHTKRQARLGQLGEVPALENVFLLKIDPGADAREAAIDFSHDPRVIYAHPNYRYRLTAESLPNENFIPDDPYITPDGDNWAEGAFSQDFPDLYGLRNIQAIEAWNEFDTNGNGKFGPGETRPGQGVVVAVIDSGLDANHEDGVSLWVNSAEIPNNDQDDDSNNLIDDVNGWDFVDGDDLPADPHGHGTHVAGTIGAAPDNETGLIGVAPWATIMPLRGLDEDGSGTTVDLANSIDYAVDMGADILSNSWGGFGFDSTLAGAFSNAHAQGVVAVAAAGNNNGQVGLVFPANIDTVIAVAAVDHEDVKASFSNFGYGIDVAAPGVATLSLSANGGDNAIIDARPSAAVDTDYMVIGGTSMACPHVSGAVAVLISKYPSESVDQLRGRLGAGADLIDVENPALVGRLGAGRVNLLASLTATPAPNVSISSVSTTGFTVSSSAAAIVLELRNDWQSVTNVQGVLSTSTSGVTIDTDTASFGTLATAATASNATSPFEVSFDPEVVAGTQVQFDLEITGAGYDVTRAFTVTRTVFENVSESADMPEGVFIPWHVVIQDYNGDGNSDISLTDGLNGHTLHENQGDGTFDQIASHADPFAAYRALMIDIDSDGDEDVFLSPLSTEAYDNILLRNDAGTLTNIISESGIPDVSFTVMSAVDFDRDGDIDILAGGTSAPVPEGGIRSTFVLRNNGDESFTDVFASSGLHKFAISDSLGKLDAVDYDNDGDSDLIVMGPDPMATRTLAVYQNDGSGVFSDVTDTAFTGTMPDPQTEAWATALAMGDYDNDGDFDLFVTQLAVDEFTSVALYRNNGDASFTNVTASTGELAETNIAGVFWGTEFFDYDNDGDLDLYVTRDGTSPREGFIETEAHTLFENNGDGTFTGVNLIAFGDTIRPNIGTAAIGDYDNDGLLDIYAPASTFGGNVPFEGGLLRNSGSGSNSWIHLDLEGTTSNLDGYGARITVVTGSLSQIREIYTAGVDVTTAHFGLGAAEVIDSIEVRWPSGIVQHWEDVEVNQRLALVECSDGDGDGSCDAVDNCEEDSNPDQSDLDNDGQGDVCDTDMDGDGYPNSNDNCVRRANPSQDDTDSDLCGNLCDGDYDQSGFTDLVDIGIFDSLFGTYDLRGDHTEPVAGPVGVFDFGVLAQLLISVPGPSGTTTDTTACPIVPGDDRDVDGVEDDEDNCPGVPNDQTDTDSDGVGDLCDNCIEDHNPGQVDTDGDQCGNICDGDYNQSGLVTIADVGIFGQIVGTTDLRGDHTEPVQGVVEDPEDFDRLSELFQTVPGPSGTTFGSTACPLD